MGPNPIYLAQSNGNGFAVAAVDGKASVRFTWIAVGRRSGFETNPDVPAELARTDFDAKMDGVMFDENDLTHSAQPVWYDGAQLRFDQPPEPVRRPKPDQPADMKRLVPAAPTMSPAPAISPSSPGKTGTGAAPHPSPAVQHEQ
jgi:hypothetical protein